MISSRFCKVTLKEVGLHLGTLWLRGPMQRMHDVGAFVLSFGFSLSLHF